MTSRLVIDGAGLRVESAGRAVLGSGHPVGLRVADGAHDARRCGYDELVEEADGIRGLVELGLPGGGLVAVEDRWRLHGDELLLDRVARVVRGGTGGFALGAALASPGHPDWAAAVPFSPGVVYGDDAPVPSLSLGSSDARLGGSGAVLIRTDRMAAPVVSVFGAGRWAAIAERDPDLRTVRVDADDREGRPIVADGIRVSSLGAAPDGGGLALQAWTPAIEGDVTYDSGALPLGAHRGWRERFQLAVVGATSRVRLAFAWGEATDDVAHRDLVWEAAWRRHRPAAEPVAVADRLDPVVDVLRSQLREAHGVAGAGLESDPVAGAPLPGADAVVMGFVGAGTDVAEVLLRAARDRDPATADDLRASARTILDAFARLPLDPPAGEGFSLADGRTTTYRELDGVPAVFLRALAEGCAAALRSADLDPDAPGSHRWRAWAIEGAGWIVRAQAADGSIPRAWEAATGRVLQASPTATVSAVPLLLAVGELTGDAVWRAAAVRAADAVWCRVSGPDGYAGGTLDNPDVVDKESAVLAMEAFLLLAGTTGDPSWVQRAAHAGRAARTWIHLVDVPMPDDVPDVDLHWKHGRRTVGIQLITSGVTMSDGFLVANAAGFARLGRATGDTTWDDIARLVHHGSVAMLATERDRFDLASAGWQQEHWNLGPARGVGLNRSWLPWTAVAVAGGAHRLIDAGFGHVLR
jgi:hypothetical protein